MKNVQIESGRFILKTLNILDASERYLRWLNQSRVKSYINYAKEERSISDLRRYIKIKEDQSDTLFLGIFTKDNLEHIGNIKYEPIDSNHGYATMGILIGDIKWQGIGVASEVITESSIWLNKNYRIKKIILGVSIENVGAIKAYKKVGFKVKSTPYISTMDKKYSTMVWDI